MISRLRRLERKLLPERAELAITESIESYIALCETSLALKEPPVGPDEMIDLIDRQSLLLPPAIPQMLEYLDACIERSLLPERTRLLAILLPHTAQAQPPPEPEEAAPPVSCPPSPKHVLRLCEGSEGGQVERSRRRPPLRTTRLLSRFPTCKRARPSPYPRLTPPGQ